MSRLLKLVFLVAVVGLFWLMTASSAPADFQIAVFNTGVDGSGTLLPNNTLGDPHYSLISGPAGSTLDTLVYTNGYPISPNGPWAAADSASAWIVPNNLNQYSPVGNYTYQTTFTLPSAGTVTLTGQWATDNDPLGIRLNGGPLTNTERVDYAFHPFTITGQGQAGTNTIDFVVHNGALPNDAGQTGLRVEFTDPGFTPAPEPASLTLLSLGGLGVIGFVWRRRKAAAT